ncbi:hypothetical protein KIPB_013033, partial [Kipferlia bialata]
NVQLVSDMGTILPTSPTVNFPVSFTAILLAPSEGAMLVGEVNKISASHVGMLFLGCLNMSARGAELGRFRLQPIMEEEAEEEGETGHVMLDADEEGEEAEVGVEVDAEGAVVKEEEEVPAEMSVVVDTTPSKPVGWGLQETKSVEAPPTEQADGDSEME